MKSIHTAITSPIAPFTGKVLKHILGEGYEFKSNDSYSQELSGERAYHQFIRDISSTSVGVYIGENGIAVDRDYDCGGNLSTTFFPFESGDTFEEKFENAYNKMTDYVNELRNND